MNSEEAERSEATESAESAEKSSSGIPGTVSQDARMWGMFCHLAALIGLIGVPFGHILGPLVIWLIKKEADPFIDHSGKQALNFQISMTIYGVIAGVLILLLIGIPLLIGLIIADLVLIIVATVKTNNGEWFNYPITIPFLK